MTLTPRLDKLERNFLINGNIDFQQRNQGNSINRVGANLSTGYSADRWGNNSTGATSFNYTIARVADVPTLAQSGFQSVWSLRVTNNAAVAAFAAGDSMAPFLYTVEGHDYAPLHGKKATLKFWLKASVAGVYSVAFRNNANDRSYVTTVTVNAANTWEMKAVTLTLDNVGTWVFDSGVGLSITIGVVSASTYQTGTLNAWQSGLFMVANTATNWVGTAGATLQISQASLTLGDVQGDFIRAGKNIAEELAMCMRYFEAPQIMAFTYALSANRTGGVNFLVQKRAVPAGTLYSGQTHTIGKVSGYSSGAEVNAFIGNINQNAITYIQATSATWGSGGTEPQAYYYEADAEF